MTQLITTKMNWQAWLCIIVLSLFWGGSFFSTKVALDAFHPVFIVFMRLGIAASVLLVCILVLAIPLPSSWSVWLQLLLLGALNNAVPFLLITWGQAHITASLASIFNATTPLFAIVIAHYFLRDERMSKAKALGVCAGFSGVVVLIGYQALSELSLIQLAQIAIVIAAMSYATASVYARRFAGVPPLVLAFSQTALAACIVGVAFVLLDLPWAYRSPAAPQWAALVSLGVVSTACAYILYFYLLAKAGAVNVLLVTFLVPVSAIILSTLFLDESLLANQIIGALLILLGLSLVDGRLWQKSNRGTSQ